MYVYISHNNDIEHAEEMFRKLNAQRKEDAFLCGELFLKGLKGYLMHSDIIERKEDLICLCDKLIVASDMDGDVLEELHFADKLGMEVEYLD